MISLSEFESILQRSIAATPAELAIGLEKVGQLAESLAAHYPGEYQSGWPQLADSTIKDKERKGFPVPSPLKRTGEMAESYRKVVDPVGLELVIGSSDPKARWQEMGTVHIPPRPVLEPALKNSLPYAAEVFGQIAIKLLTGKI